MKGGREGGDKVGALYIYVKYRLTDDFEFTEETLDGGHCLVKCLEVISSLFTLSFRYDCAFDEARYASMHHLN